MGGGGITHRCPVDKDGGQAVPGVLNVVPVPPQVAVLLKLLIGHLANRAMVRAASNSAADPRFVIFLAEEMQAFGIKGITVSLAQPHL